jgi:multicomponent Na+:H+ antiporter subunit D
MVYVMARVALYIFTPAFAFETVSMGPVFVWLAVIAIVMGSLLALVQKRLKRILAYVIIAEVGYMVGGFWLGNQAGITGAILHIVNDAAMTLCLFLTLANLDFRGIDDSFEGLRGVFRKMPYSMAAFAIGALAIIGVPPTCGFFSKWYLITGGLAAGHYGFVAALIFSSLVNVILFFKIIEIAYFEPFADHHHGGHHGPVAVAYQEAPWTMVLPLLAVAAGLIVLGLFSGGLVNQIIHFALPAGII